MNLPLFFADFLCFFVPTVEACSCREVTLTSLSDSCPPGIEDKYINRKYELAIGIDG